MNMGERLKIAVVTAYQPNEYNEGGGPTGLLWEILDFLKKENDAKIDIIHNPLPQNRLLKIIRRNGIYFSKLGIDLKKYDYIIAYPDDMIFYIPKETWGKVIVLGPDSPSFRDARTCRMNRTCYSKVIKKIMTNISRYNEYRTLKNVYKYIVVGSTDEKYMRQNKFLINRKSLKDKIIFLRHPILQNVISDNYDDTLFTTKRFIFTITPEKHNKEFFDALFFELGKVEVDAGNEINIMLVGKRSEWMMKHFEKIRCCKPQYVPWVENYKDVCVYGRDVHCMPLLVGSGTKNRTLTALASCLEVITTPIGIENIHWKGVSGIYITSNPKQFVEYMLKVNNTKIMYEKEKFINERRKMIEKTQNEYSQTLKKVFVYEN